MIYHYEFVFSVTDLGQTKVIQGPNIYKCNLTWPADSPHSQSEGKDCV